MIPNGFSRSKVGPIFVLAGTSDARVLRPENHLDGSLVHATVPYCTATPQPQRA
jgi:hypothetical protein